MMTTWKSRCEPALGFWHLVLVRRKIWNHETSNMRGPFVSSTFLGGWNCCGNMDVCIFYIRLLLFLKWSTIHISSLLYLNICNYLYWYLYFHLYCTCICGPCLYFHLYCTRICGPYLYFHLYCTRICGLHFHWLCLLSANKCPPV